MSYKVVFGKLVSNRANSHYRKPYTPPVMPADKGHYGGSCNRSHCLKPGANWYNHGSRAYYCRGCAEELNYDKFNYKQAMQDYGHVLCTEGEQK